MSEFKAGDKVLVNGALVATIQSYNPEVDRLSYVSVPPGGGTDTTYGHISQTRLEHLVSEAVSVPAEEEPAEVAEVESVQDAITTSESL